MSFLSDTLLPGSSRLHIIGSGASRNGQTALRKSKSHAGLLSPLVQLIRDPLNTIGNAVGGVEYSNRLNSLPEAEVDQREVFKLRLRNAESYEDWKTAATQLDALEENNAWKAETESSEYDVALVAARLQQLDDARISCDVKRMLFLIRTSLTRGLGGMGDLRLYKHSHIGTKRLIERYIDSAQKTLTALLEVTAKQGESCPVQPRVLVEQLLLARQSFGRSALLLSGGGTFGMNHIGVVKCLWQANLLPRIISGASAGSIVCAVLCSKTDAEIPATLEEFCYGNLAVFEKEGERDGLMKKVVRFLKYGALFDISHLMGVMRGLLGDITFQESYNRTRRILNITVSSASLYELPRLLNYVTAPNVMIWSAVCASCSVPLVFSAASLLAKDPQTGKEVPWNPNPTAGWIDGSVDNDLPMTRLAEMFNVNHFIVSQVNPHVVPFLAREEEIVGAEAQQNPAVTARSTWIHNLANLAKGEALHRLHVLSELGVFPNYVGKVRSVLHQRYSGDITILPTITYAQFPHVLSNPTTEYMLNCLLTGERATWPKLSRIQNHLAIELALDETVRQLRTRVVFSPSQIDLRLNNLNRPLSQGNMPFPKLPSKLGVTRSDTAPPTPLTTASPPGSLRRATQSRNRVLSDAQKQYLPTYPWQRNLRTTVANHNTSLDAFSSSNTYGSSEDDALSDESNTSAVLSAPSPPHSPSSLWPSACQLFNSSSRPFTASLLDSVDPSATLTDRDMKPNDNTEVASPSSPELRYKPFFHPPSLSAEAPAAPVAAGLGLDIDMTTQPLEFNLSPRRTMTLPES